MNETLPSGLALSVTIQPANFLSEKLHNFVTGTWAKSAGRLCVPYTSGKGILDRTRTFSKRSDHVLRSPSTYVALADFADVGGDDVPVGWIVAAPNLLHFAYVRRPYRSLGVAALLLKALAAGYSGNHSECPFPSVGWIPCTHWTVKLPDTGWLQFDKARLLYYAGFEPLNCERLHGT